jgi:hypothetical protein
MDHPDHGNIKTYFYNYSELKEFIDKDSLGILIESNAEEPVWISDIKRRSIIDQIKRREELERELLSLTNKAIAKKFKVNVETILETQTMAGN